MESSLEIGFLRVTEKAAIAAARTMGYGKRKYSDQVAVESMREELNKLKMRGTIVIGEGERDKAPMLYVGEPLGRGWTEGEIYPEVDIAVDPLEGTNLCATGAANSIAVLAASEEGGAPAPPVGCTTGGMQGRLKPLEKWQEDRLKSMGYHDGEKVYATADLAAGNDIIFCAAGVTDGDLLRGVRFFGGGIRTSSLFMSLKTGTIRFVDTIFREEGSQLAVSFS